MDVPFIDKNGMLKIEGYWGDTKNTYNVVGLVRHDSHITLLLTP